MNLESIAPKFYASANRVVSIGGGHGLAATLNALKTRKIFPVGVVSVADDGGSSGRLRETFGHIPPGDLRRCVSALLPPSSPWLELLEYRFDSGELKGHALGNLIFTALNETNASAVDAAVKLCQLVGAQGLILPTAEVPLTLKGEFAEIELLGQVLLAQTSGLSNVSLLPKDPIVPEVVLEAIDSATAITLGPGSLFTSVIAVCGIPAIRRAIVSSNAKVIFVANLAPQMGEAENFTIAAHVREVIELDIDVNWVLYDDSSIKLGDIFQFSSAIRWVNRAMATDDKRVHSPELLGSLLVQILSDANHRL